MDIFIRDEEIIEKYKAKKEENQQNEEGLSFVSGQTTCFEMAKILI